MRLSSDYKIVPVLAQDDINAGATCESINCKNLQHVTLLITFSEALAGDAILKVREGATDGATTADLTFAYRYGGAATKSASADVLSTEATSAALTMTGTTFVSRLLIVEIDMDQMTDGYSWLTPNINSDASDGACSIVAVCYPKYASMALDTVLT